MRMIFLSAKEPWLVEGVAWSVDHEAQVYDTVSCHDVIEKITRFGDWVVKSLARDWGPLLVWSCLRWRNLPIFPRPNINSLIAHFLFLLLQCLHLKLWHQSAQSVVQELPLLLYVLFNLFAYFFSTLRLFLQFEISVARMARLQTETV